MENTTDTTTATPAEIAHMIWAEMAGRDLDRALDLRDRISEISELPGSVWAEVEDLIWDLAKG